MKAMKIKKTLTILSAFALILMVNSCDYNELPPKTDDLSKDYVLPKGERPTAEETKQVHKIREEYNNSIKK